MALNKPLFDKVAPEYSTMTVSELSILTTEAEKEVSEKCFGDKTEHAVALLVAHMLKIAERNGTSGQITMEKVGRLERQYSDLEEVIDSLQSTTYGLEFIRLRKQNVVTPFFVC